MGEKDAAWPLKALEPEREFFIAIDSDGCIFDTMEIKHKECFIPNIIKHWGLQAISKYARAASEFVNLYSQWRGVNRFPALTITFDLLADWPAVQARGVEIPKAASLRKWISQESKLGHPALKAAIEASGDAELKRTLAWSEAINATVAEMVEGVSPFPFVRESLEKIRAKADLIVCSGTPDEALRREWEEHDIVHYPRVIAGQEMGSKTEHISFAARENYPKEKMLMIGDAPGDRKAAEANGALFFPVNPGHEEDSWQQFHDEGFEKFISGTFAGAYQAGLIEAFESYLPEKPPWKR